MNCRILIGALISCCHRLVHGLFVEGAAGCCGVARPRRLFLYPGWLSGLRGVRSRSRRCEHYRCLIPARGIVASLTTLGRQCRVVPALTGNTVLYRHVLFVPDLVRASGSSPRWRGTQSSVARKENAERSIPRAWGTRPVVVRAWPVRRFIPALAGNTMAARHWGRRRSVHPLDRGTSSRLIAGAFCLVPVFVPSAPSRSGVRRSR